MHDELMRCSASAVKHLRERAEILVAADRDSDVDVLRGAGGFAPLAGVDDEVSCGRADDEEFDLRCPAERRQISEDVFRHRYIRATREVDHRSFPRNSALI